MNQKDRLKRAIRNSTVRTLMANEKRFSYLSAKSKKCLEDCSEWLEVLFGSEWISMKSAVAKEFAYPFGHPDGVFRVSRSCHPKFKGAVNPVPCGFRIVTLMERYSTDFPRHIPTLVHTEYGWVRTRDESGWEDDALFLFAVPYEYDFSTQDGTGLHTWLTGSHVVHYLKLPGVTVPGGSLPGVVVELTMTHDMVAGTAVERLYKAAGLTPCRSLTEFVHNVLSGNELMTNVLVLQEILSINSTSNVHGSIPLTVGQCVVKGTM